MVGSAGAPVACGQDIAGTGFLTTYQYDALSNLLQVNQTGIAPRTFTYDSLSRLTSAFNPESGTISYTYDANGNLLTKTAPAPNQTGTATVTTTYQYDALNRLTQKSYSDGTTPAVSFTYDTSGCPTCYHYTIGRLANSSVPGWAFNYGYDPMGRLLDKDLSMSSPAGTLYLDYTYDLLGDMTSETAGYGTATYGYNTAGRLTSVTNSYSDANNPAHVFSIAGNGSDTHYNAFGSLTSNTLGDGEVETYSYDKRGRFQSYTAKLGTTPIYSFNITSFAPNSNVLAATDTANGNWTYTYDPFNRLVGANQNSGQAIYNYVYDRFGNRWQQNGPHTFLATFTGNNSTNNNRMDGYSYDAAGNLLNDGTHGYTYDAENRIIKVDNGNTATYVYDADGNRVQKTSVPGGSYGDPPGTWQFLYDQSGRMVQRYDGTLWQTNIFAGARHLVTLGAGTTFSHSDWLGTERARNLFSNQLLETCSSLPFGDALTCQGGGDWSPLHFTGKERDSESGLDNFGARYYSSSFGRFMRPDPNGAGASTRAPQSWNAYSYVLNNPINATDPTGLWCVWEDNTHDDRPEEGGATEAQCGEQGGHWDPTDTITGMDAAGNLMQEIQVEGMLTDDDRIKIVAAGVDSLTSTSSLSEVAVNGMTWATAAEGIWELPGMIRGGWRAIASWRMASKMAGVGAAGEAGEALAGIAKNTERIESVTGAAYRIPDILDKDAKIIGEVKNYSGTLSLTEQIKDDIAFAKKNGYTMVLRVSQSTELTQPLRLLVNDGTIKLIRFP